MASTMQSIVPLNVGKYTNVNAKKQFLIPTRSQRNINMYKMRVRSTAKDIDQVNEQESPVVPPQPIPTPPPPTPAPKVSTSFSDILAFSGPAPERINGRLAMVGFVAAAAIEAFKGQDLFSQISNGGVLWFVATSVVFSLASLIPLLRGVTAESKSGGVMTSDAELLNGRLAMLGLVALAVTDFVKYY